VLLGKSLLRLGICRPSDWTGSGVDFVEKGFNRFCLEQGSKTAGEVFRGELHLSDTIFELNEVEQAQRQAEMEEPASEVFLVSEFSSSILIQVGAALALLGTEDGRLPAMWLSLFQENLWKWVRVYGHLDAREEVSMRLECIDPEETDERTRLLAFETTFPSCLRTIRNGFKSGPRVRRFVEGLRPKDSRVRTLQRLVLEMDEIGQGIRHPWPGHIPESEIPGLTEYLERCEGAIPGALITWYEQDMIHALFDEWSIGVQEGGEGFAPNTLLRVNLDKPATQVDVQVNAMFAYTGAMLRALAKAAKIAQLVWEIDDEAIRQHRLKSGLQTESGAAVVRRNQS
jgi:hypothetical protein